MGLFIPVFQLVEKRFMAFTIEAPFALFQKPIKMLFFDAIEPS